ncbi:aminotransferase class IV [Chryseobacterium arthrosphaerae]|uniref:Aminodeoxychorismate lyase n=1 Tax=Chryseobacterium arthrosphaerae TaxID=651561 RepID=A0A1B8ZAM8_9FLAO|nr:aminotransferase class IV [Chryseobacterium arthrosphaerae]MDG4654741.1 aminotransferase class IV [Chryseobacterium arthrosphaerae]OCA68671.1 aminodeoxychorismate lyase [Chryseobacterium arthrosphaerae]QUY55104.1 aminotransferase class IV [Chryseobacterium arthrosphaerae]RTZ50220.1 aminodeoxychorismate lyase [Chryseobacterium arthrosphaerae]UEQ74984.1 aminotransferase class IV [Chryseobacterium arthrosphaerae]
MSQFIESIKVEDQEVFLLDLHQKRVNQTFSHFGKEDSIDLAKIYKNLQHDEDGLFKLRISYDLDKRIRTQMIPYAIPEIQDFKLMENNSFDYSFKFEDRKELDKMKMKSKAEEIIIVKNNHITDTSFSNLLFLKGKDWYTPNTYLLNGVQRQHLLKQKKIKETEITLQNIKQFSHFQLINALNDFDDMFIYPIDRIINLPGNEEYLDL